MRRISILVAAAILSLQNSGARAQSSSAVDLLALPHPAMVAGLALAGMACLLLLAQAPLTPTGLKTGWRRSTYPSFWPSHRASMAIFAVVMVAGSVGMA